MTHFRNIAAHEPAEVTTGGATGVTASRLTRLPQDARSVAGFYSKGFSLIEVLVTIVILLIGLLGLAGLQGRALTTQMEAYQRSQALILLKDMADRINANRANAVDYDTSGLSPTFLGTDSLEPIVDCTTVAIGKDRDFCEWNKALLGAAETQGTNKVGAMIGARGCVTEITAAVPASGIPGTYLVAVVWQGLNKTAALPAITCGSGLYSDEKLRRVVAIPISIAILN